MPTVSGTVTDSSGGTSSWSATWAVTAPSSPWKTFPGAEAKVRMGMRCPDSERDARRNEVQAAPSTKQLRAWRIFVDPGSWTQPNVESTIIDWAIARNMIPVITYKDRNAPLSLVNDTADFLQSKGVPIAVGWWHEPRGDTSLGSTTAAQQSTWRAEQARLSPIFRARANLSFGPIANGFLVSTANGKTELANWLPNADLAGDLYDWVGADFYQADPNEVPSLSTPWPGERMRQFADWLDQRGFPQHRLLVGEYNGNHADVLEDACEALLEDPRWWCGMLFNSYTGNKGIVLEHDTNAGDRLGAFQAGISDARAYQ